jgi:hypothetical protein
MVRLRSRGKVMKIFAAGRACLIGTKRAGKLRQTPPCFSPWLRTMSRLPTIPDHSH